MSTKPSNPSDSDSDPDPDPDFERVNVDPNPNPNPKPAIKLRDIDGAPVDPHQLKSSGTAVGKLLGGLLAGALKLAIPLPSKSSMETIPPEFLTVRYVNPDGAIVWVSFLRAADAAAVREGLARLPGAIVLDTVRTNTLPRSPTWDYEFEDPQAYPLNQPELRRGLTMYSPVAAAIRHDLTTLFGVAPASAVLLTSIVQEH